MTSPESSNPVVHRLVAAINDGDRGATAPVVITFLSCHLSTRQTPNPQTR